MHNNIYEISCNPIPAEQRARAGNIPGWFYEQICDYAENPGSAKRELAIQTLSKLFGNFCIRDGDKFILSPQIRASFFRKSYSYFKAAAEVLSHTDYDIFSGLTPSPAFQLALSGLNDSYEDTRGIYIYSTETELLVTLEYWLRNADLSLPFYIGGVVDYHY